MANIHIKRLSQVSPSAQHPIAVSMPWIQNAIQQKIRCKNKDSVIFPSFHLLYLNWNLMAKCFVLIKVSSLVLFNFCLYGIIDQ